MRHRKAGVKLNRTSSHRHAMFRNMVTSLFKHERIRTTEAKAKELRRWADHLITLAKRGDLHARRQVLSIIREKEVVHKLFEQAAERFGAISGGYTRVVKLGRRPGDAAPVSLVELVVTKETKKKKTRKKKGKAADTKKKTVATEKQSADEKTDKAAKAEVTSAKAKTTEADTKVEVEGKTKKTAKKSDANTQKDAVEAKKKSTTGEQAAKTEKEENP
jgi:large subunit ribosomal protein L17